MAEGFFNMKRKKSILPNTSFDSVKTATAPESFFIDLFKKGN